jgi:23S rRNA pseudouridine1911/1915/1917 synthase
VPGTPATHRAAEAASRAQAPHEFLHAKRYDPSVSEDEDEILLPGATLPLVPPAPAGDLRSGAVPKPPQIEEHEFEVEEKDDGLRLDVYLAQRLPMHSRTWLARHVAEGHVTLARADDPAAGEGHHREASDEGSVRKIRSGIHIETGDVIAIRLMPRTAAYAIPERIPLTILHEDPYLVVINKPAGLTVHPGSGEKSGTLANAIAYHFGELSHVQGPMRPGIVHRLDKDTSGVILVAKDDQTHWSVANQFRERTVKKEYHAVARGVISFDADLISGPIGPDRRHPTRMAIRLDVGRASETYFEVIERFSAHTYIRCMPKTGRTHQIRVHMMSAGHPLVSDRVYGGFVPALAEHCPRQALHARRLEITHPATGERMAFEAPLPEDFARLLEHLRK